MSTDASNGKVTLALLGQKIDTLTATVEKFCDNMEPRVRHLENRQGVIAERVETAEEEVNKLRSINYVWSSFNTIGTVIATALGLK